MGWAPHESVEIISVEDMIKDFSLARVHKGGARFDFEKAKWFNHEYMKLKNGAELAAYLQPILAEKNIEAPGEFVAEVCDVVKLRSTLIPDLWENGHFFFAEPSEYDTSIIATKWNPASKTNVDNLQGEMKNWQDFTAASIDKLLHEFMGNRKIKAGDLLPLMRIMLIGSKNGPAVYEIISLLGKEKSIARMKKAMELFDEMKVVQ
jgi:glutamyl-tRNA synthetase